MRFSKWLKQLKEFKLNTLQEFIANDKLNMVKSAVNPDQFAMFFVWKNDVYGATENSRMIFANMINPSPDIVDLDKFFATNLSAIANSQNPYPRIFTKKDINGIHILDQQHAVAQILNGK